VPLYTPLPKTQVTRCKGGVKLTINSRSIHGPIMIKSRATSAQLTITSQSTPDQLTDGGDRNSHICDYQNFQQVFTTIKISNKFSPYNSNTGTFSRESPHFHSRFQVCKRSPRHSKDLTIKSLNLVIQICWIWSPPWVVTINSRSTPDQLLSKPR